MVAQFATGYVRRAHSGLDVGFGRWNVRLSGLPGIRGSCSVTGGILKLESWRGRGRYISCTTAAAVT
ncbi:hypothetical protein, partial [Micromonospora sp. CPCC 205556]|uniref:hypothetical protein n=1 Tax=Micromonospora sp. CPCC 205556 TaxID=3122398 RepID=UPI002FEF5A0C